ncbi:MAG TPA: hypothetical protein DEQ84_04305 [Prevotellaceae bacterium]|nr:hypothetical protein [Prevotellaceae bacterium]
MADSKKTIIPAGSLMVQYVMFADFSDSSGMPFILTSAVVRNAPLHFEFARYVFPFTAFRISDLPCNPVVRPSREKLFAEIMDSSGL